MSYSIKSKVILFETQKIIEIRGDDINNGDNEAKNSDDDELLNSQICIYLIRQNNGIVTCILAQLSVK